MDPMQRAGTYEKHVCIMGHKRNPKEIHTPNTLTSTVDMYKAPAQTIQKLHKNNHR